MKIIVCNIGSTSFKFQLLDMSSEKQIARGHAERIGMDFSPIVYYIDDKLCCSTSEHLSSHSVAVQHALNFLIGPQYELFNNLNEIDGIGFKAIQAGEKNGSVLLDKEVLDAMEYYRDLAPAHNPPYLDAIYMFKEMLPQTPLVGVFEPGFHINAPDYAKIYGTPYEWIEKYGVKKYGYHGASHRFVTWETVKLLGLPEDNHKIITCHLGGSSSICAFKNGVSIDTSMGFSPQTGLIQGTRIGDMDPFVLPYIMEKKGISLEEALVECSKQSGLAGLSGTSGDMRDIIEAIGRGDKKALLARNKFIYDIKRYIGEFIVIMEGLDAITFTGGIGQKDADLRKKVLNSLDFLELKLDHHSNDQNEKTISSENSKIKALVLETNEEIVVAKETLKVISKIKDNV
jgi:acetate kinase